MNRSPDVELVLRDYFADDSSTAPDHVLDVIEQRIRRQRQQRPWRLPWRLRMNAPVKLAVIASAVIVVAIAGYNLLPHQPSVGGPSPSLLARGAFVIRDWGPVEFEATREGSS